MYISTAVSAYMILQHPGRLEICAQLRQQTAHPVWKEKRLCEARTKPIGVCGDCRTCAVRPGRVLAAGPLLGRHVPLVGLVPVGTTPGNLHVAQEGGSRPRRPQSLQQRAHTHEAVVVHLQKLSENAVRSDETSCCWRSAAEAVVLKQCLGQIAPDAFQGLRLERPWGAADGLRASCFDYMPYHCGQAATSDSSLRRRLRGQAVCLQTRRVERSMQQFCRQKGTSAP